MKIHDLHRWNVTPLEAIALQKKLASKICTGTPLAKCNIIAGADVSYNRFSTTFFASVLVIHTGDWSIVEKQEAIREITFPYVPGLLSFREAPVLLDAFAKVRNIPDVVMIDGHGTAHPRRLGIACHIGLILDMPTFGCAKSLLTGKYKEPGKRRGSRSQLRDKSEVIGAAVRTRDAVNPVFVSPGHKINQASAIRLVLECGNGYRLPEPTRQAHLHVNALRRNGPNGELQNRIIRTD